MKVTMEEQKLYDDFTASVFQRGYEKGKEDANISYQNAYNEGHVDGYAKGVDDRDSDIKRAYHDGYNAGLNDAWEAAKKIHDGQIPYEVFGLDKTGNGVTYASPLNWGENMSPSEAIAKIKQYEEKQKAPSVARACSILDDICPYDIPCAECEVHCSIERAKQKLKGDK